MPAIRSCQAGDPQTKKRLAVLDGMPWERFRQLLLDAQLLVQDARSAGVEVEVDRMMAMLVLTAIHDIMKVST